MKFSGWQKSVLAVEILAMLAGGGVLIFVPAKPAAPPKITRVAQVFDTTGLISTPIVALSAEERARLDDALKIDLNTASAAEIERIPRIGPSMANQIVAFRTAHGPFKSFAELDQIPRLGPSIMEIMPKYARLSGVDSATAMAPAQPLAPASGADINALTVEQLVALKIPRLGQAMAQKIVDYRTANGPFGSYEDLDKVPGVGEAMLESLRGANFSFGGARKPVARPGPSTTAPAPASAPAAPASAPGGKINLNTATAQQLDSLPGVGPAMAEAILAYRKQKGRIKSVDELDEIPRVGPALLEKIRPLVTVN